MIAVRVQAPLSPEVIQELMLFGRTIDKELERIIGEPALYSMVLALHHPGGVIMHRMANVGVQEARGMFALASRTPMVEQFIQTLQEH